MQTTNYATVNKENLLSIYRFPGGGVLTIGVAYVPTEQNEHPEEIICVFNFEEGKRSFSY